MSNQSNRPPGNYEVGYKKPPKEHRFRPGTSGNPKGKPKGSKNFETDLKEVLNAPVPVTENGKTRVVSSQRAAVLRLREKALNGDPRALDKLLDLARIHNAEDLAAATDEAVDPLGQAILDDYVERRLAQQKRRQTAEDTALSADDDRDAENEDDDEENPDAWLR